MGSQVIETKYYCDEDHDYKEVPVEISVIWDESAPYPYGADADGNRDETRTDCENFAVDEIVIPTEGDLPESLCDEIRDYFEKLGGAYWAERICE